MIKTHGASTTNITADKKREDNESHCEGMMSMICVATFTAAKSCVWIAGLRGTCSPDKKSYREDVFATPAEMAEIRAKNAGIGFSKKCRSCPVSQRQQPIDKSKCEMSEPKNRRSQNRR